MSLTERFFPDNLWVRRVSCVARVPVGVFGWPSFSLCSFQLE